MLVPNQKIRIKITKHNIDHFRSHGYECNLKDIIYVSPNQLTDGSHERIEVVCDNCNITFSNEWRRYIKHKSDGDDRDFCKSCGEKIRRAETNIKRYGVTAAIQNEEIHEKIKNTCLKKYGVDNPLKSPEVKEKIIKKNIEKYGVEWSIQSSEVKDKIKQSNLKKYGYEYHLSSPIIKEKIAKTNIEKYGVPCYFNSEEFKEKKIKTSREKYGVDCPFQSSEVKEKIKKTILEKYGVKYSGMSENNKTKRKQTCLEKYGVSSYLQTEECKEKVKEHWRELYGVDYAFQSPEFIEHVNKKMIENGGTVKTSSQQLEVFNMLQSKDYNVVLNYPVKSFSLDVALFINDIKIDIEYDGWYWHQDKQKDRARDEVLKTLGWKIFRIKGEHKVPNIVDLENGIKYLLDGHDFAYIVLPDWRERKEESA